MKLILFPCLALSSFWLAAFASEPDDWPVWRHDALRSGATAHALPPKLALRWTSNLGTPDPAFDYHFRLCADQSYEPVAAGGVLFVPSNVRDGITSYDLLTGEEKWEFITEGPVRFAPVVDGDLVFFGSDDGFLYAVTAKTGELRWKTRGAPADRPDQRLLVNGRMSSRWPVRGGPVLHEGTLFFGCGLWPAEGVFLAAVDPSTGAVRWRNADIAQLDDGLEEHGKMADLGLPPHGYLAIIAGKVAMPSGRALAAFADPLTGKLDPYNSFYAKMYPAPRGSWALAGSTEFWFQGGALMGTSGAMLESLPLGPLTVEDFARLAGQPVAWAEDVIRRGWVNVRGEGDARRVLVDPRSPQTALNIKPKGVSTAQLFQLTERPVLNMALLGTRHEVGERGIPVFAGQRLYRSEFRDPRAVEVERGMTHVAVPSYDVLRAYKLNEASWQLHLTPSGRGTGRVQRQLHFPVEWELPVPQLTVKLLAGDRLYLAGANKIVAVALPGADPQPRIVWEERVHGFPVGMIAANGHLAVTTDTGRLHVFGAPDGSQPQTPAAAPPAPWERTVEWRAHVKQLRDRLTGGGYALVLGWNSGELAKELALQTELQVIVVETDPALAAQARKSLPSAPLWARRLHILSGTSDSLKLPPCFAEIVLSESFASLDNGARLWTRAALDALRPHTGQAVLPLRPLLIEQAKACAEETGGYEFHSEKRWTTIRRTSAPRGADDWTHEAANAANTFASRDTRAVPPFGLLWFSGGIDREFSPAFEYHHNRNPYPVILEGRMFMLAGSMLHAADAYTGRHLWKTAVPESAKAARRLADHRTFSRPTDQNLIAAGDRVYVFRETDAQMFDTVTGQARGEIRLPDDLAGTLADTHWDEVRISGETMFVACGHRLIALDRRSGEARWHRECGEDRVAFCLSEDRVFTIPYPAVRSRVPDPTDPFETMLTVLDAKDGAVCWSAPVQAPGRPQQSGSSAGKPGWTGIFQDNPLKPTLHFNAAHQIVLAILDRHQFFAFDARDGRAQWQHRGSSRLTDLVTFEPPVVTRDFVICADGAVLDARNGQPARPQQVGGRGTGCNRFVGSDALISFRSALACFLDLETSQRTYLSSTRSGCTNSMIPAAGLLNAPNFAHGCVCNYPFLTSFSLFHLPEAAQWAPQARPDVETNESRNAD